MTDLDDVPAWAKHEIATLRAELQQVKDELERRTRAMYEAHDADHAELQQVKDALQRAYAALPQTGMTTVRSILGAALEGTDQ